MENVTNLGKVETVEIVEQKKPYEFRILNSTDVFLMFKIIGKIGVKEFNACFKNDGIKDLVMAMMGEKKAEGENASFSVTYIEIIFEIADVIFKNLPKCESEVYQMLSNTSNLSFEEVKTLDAPVFIEMILDFIKKREFADFIEVVSRLFK